MKRDLDLMRKVLELVEQDDSGVSFRRVTVDRRSAVEVSYAIQLLNEAGLMHACDVAPPRSPDQPPLLDPALSGFIEWLAGPITHRGHEFLDMTRDPVMWEAIKRRVEKRTLGRSLEMIIALLERTYREDMDR